MTNHTVLVLGLLLSACATSFKPTYFYNEVLIVNKSRQLVQDVKLAAEGSRNVELYGTAGGIVPSPEQVAERVRLLLGNKARATIDVPANPQWLPVCEQAQADGVPCTEVGRDCEVCERSYARLHERMTPPSGYR